MTLRFSVFGVEVAALVLDIPADKTVEKVADKAVKGFSRLWVRKMTS